MEDLFGPIISIMDREGFIEALRKQYADELHEAYLECEHTAKVDMVALKTRIDKLKRQAKVEGLPEREFDDLVESALPEEVYGTLYRHVAKAA